MGSSATSSPRVADAAQRYAVVLPAGTGGTFGFAATNAWLFVTDHLPSRVHPGATVFHPQWGESGACVPYPAPGYTVAPGRPFYIDY